MPPVGSPALLYRRTLLTSARIFACVRYLFRPGETADPIPRRESGIKLGSYYLRVDQRRSERLPQLAVSAKLLCLLMVVICGAVPSMVRSVRLYNQCSSNTIRVNMNGTVFASDSIPEKFQNLTIQSHDFEVKLTIFAEASAKFLCFNKRWKLVGSRKDHGKRCQFSEDMDEKGYSRYRSVADSSYYVGFHSNGRPLGRNKARQKNSRCINFLKYDTEFSIKDHNSKIAGANHHSPKVHENLQQAKKKHQQNNSRNKQQTRRTPVRIRHKNHHRNSRRLS